MVFTHLPSNVLLIAIPLAPTYPLAVVFLLLRYSISQMDVPARQSYVAGVVHPSELSAAAGVTGSADACRAQSLARSPSRGGSRAVAAASVARSVGGALGPLLTGYFSDRGSFNDAFYWAGGIKIAYDLILLAAFRAIKPIEERDEPSSSSSIGGGGGSSSSRG